MINILIFFHSQNVSLTSVALLSLGSCLMSAGIQTDSVLSARLQIIRIYIREDGRLVIEFKTHAKFRGQFTTSAMTRRLSPGKIHAVMVLENVCFLTTNKLVVVVVC